MSDIKTFLLLIRRRLEDLRDGVLSGPEFVRQYDNTMADEIPDEFTGPIYQLLDDYHTEFAMYVEDPRLRAGEPDYYGDDVLHRKAQQLLKQLDRLQMEDG